MKTLMEQIRCVKARDGVVKEIAQHMEDQIQAYEEDGMSYDDAVKEAVRQMGDPVAVGVELDHIHRPRTDWKMIIMVIIFQLAGLGIQFMTRSSYSFSMQRQLMFVIIGMVIMLGVYYLDYSFIGKHAKSLYWGMLVLLFVTHLFWEVKIHGQMRWLIMPMYLLVPIYAGVLYQYRNQSYWGMVKCILYMIPAAIFATMIIPSVPTAFHLLVIMCCMLVFAVMKKWFRVNRLGTILSLLGIGIVLPVSALGVWYAFLARDFQRARIHAILHPEQYEMSAGYLVVRARECMEEVWNKAFSSGVWIGSVGEFPVDDSNYILIHLISSYGLLFAVIVLVAFTLFVIRAFHITTKQKNQLGFMIGSGCALILLVMILEGVAMNFGWFVGTNVYFPFITYGGSATLVYSILIGLLLSIYRYQNVLSDIEITKKGKHLRISISLKE